MTSDIYIYSLVNLITVIHHVQVIHLSSLVHAAPCWPKPGLPSRPARLPHLSKRLKTRFKEAPLASACPGFLGPPSFWISLIVELFCLESRETPGGVCRRARKRPPHSPCEHAPLKTWQDMPKESKRVQQGDEKSMKKAFSWSLASKSSALELDSPRSITNSASLAIQSAPKRDLSRRGRQGVLSSIPQ